MDYGQNTTGRARVRKLSIRFVHVLLFLGQEFQSRFGVLDVLIVRVRRAEHVVPDGERGGIVASERHVVIVVELGAYLVMSKTKKKKNGRD